MMRKLNRIAAFVAASFGTLVLMMGPASAAAPVITPNPIQVTTGQNKVTVDVTFTPTTKRIFVLQCFADGSDPNFDYASKCSNLSEYTQNVDQNPSGKFKFDVFRGPEPSGDETWGCFAAADPAPLGITKNTTCYLRLTTESEGNTTDQVFTPFTFAVSNPVIPEVPLAVMLPILALAVFGGGLYLQRRRRPATS